MIKSPSDSTLYAPALKRVNEGDVNKVIETGMMRPERGADLNVIENVQVCNLPPLGRQNNDVGPSENLISKVSDFVDVMRLESDLRRGTTSVNEPVAGPSGVQRRQSQQPQNEEYEVARMKAQQEVIDAKRFKANIATPPGENNYITLPVNNELFNQPCRNEVSIPRPVGLGEGLSDDDFLHLTCHIDGSLRSKIEKGEYVDLEKLLPKDKSKSKLSDDTRMEWVHHDGNTYLVFASDQQNKINGIRRWDQAFRVYATIFCGANPHRSHEIWQYVSVINTAVASYAWDNVATYDYTFRHLMEFNPSRSWATTYNQMWNLSMKDPISKGNFGHGKTSTATFQNSNHAKPNSNTQNSSIGGKKKGRPTYCWFFNRGEKCKYGSKCHFIECCSYCDATDHPVLSCPKLVKKDNKEAIWLYAELFLGHHDGSCHGLW